MTGTSNWAPRLTTASCTILGLTIPSDASGTVVDSHLQVLAVLDTDRGPSTIIGCPNKAHRQRLELGGDLDEAPLIGGFYSFGESSLLARKHGSITRPVLYVPVRPP